MIYSLLKFLCRITIRAYFRRYQVDGQENIPRKGPSIFVANHPSAFMDPIIVATVVKPQMYFIAAGEYMGKGFKAWFLQKAFHMIPVYRPSTLPGETHKNADMFKSCYKHLGKGRSLLIFPEGVSITERKLKPLKTGVSRIAMGAELANQLELGLQIVPIGLNYSDPHRFRSDVYVRIGEPISAVDFIQNSQIDTEEVRQLTAAVELEMRKTILHLDSEEEETLLLKVEKVYSSELRKEFAIEFDEQDREFEMQQELIQAIEYFNTREESKVTDLSREIDDYFDQLRSLGLAHRSLKTQTTAYRIGLKLGFLFGAPFFLLGFLLNALPYFIVQSINKRLKIDETFQGSLILATGLIVYLLWYIGLTVGGSFIQGLSWWSLLIPPIAYTSGLYALIYTAAYQRSRNRKSAERMAKFDEEGIEDLHEQRQEILKKLENFKEQYLRLFGDFE